MATIKAFKAIRPAKKYVEKLAALPYDVMNSNEAREMVIDNPYSFLRIDKAEIGLDKDIDIYDEKVYQKASDVFNEFIEKEIFIQDKDDSLYIYEQTMNDRVQTGLVACSSVDDYLNGIVKKHEFTRKDKELDRTKHLESLNAQTGPIFLAYRKNDDIKAILEKYKNENDSIYDFVSDDKIKHIAWKITNPEIINTIVDIFSKIENTYIADGHHRNASAANIAIKRREENKNYDPTDEYNYYLSVLFADNELYVMDYNRLLKDLNSLSIDDFLKEIKRVFDIEKVDSEVYTSKKAELGMYLNKQWYKLNIKDEFKSSDVLENLDVSILQKEILSKVLNINDPRTDERIDFIGGIRGIKELAKRVDSGEFELAFSLFPTSMDELLAVADSDRTMPPKSTWFEPKLRSGMFIHSLK